MSKTFANYKTAIDRALEPFASRVASVEAKRKRSQHLEGESRKLSDESKRMAREWHESGESAEFDEAVKRIVGGESPRLLQLKSRKEEVGAIQSQAEAAHAAAREIAMEVQQEQDDLNIEIKRALRPVQSALFAQFFAGCEAITEALNEFRGARDHLNSKQINGVSFDLSPGFFINSRIDEDSPARRWFETFIANGYCDRPKGMSAI